MKTTKRFFSLIEVAIGFSLIAIICSALLSSFAKTRFFAKKIEGVKSRVLEEHFCYQMLSDIFAKADPSSFTKITEPNTEQETLSFVFHNKLDKELVYSGRMHGLLKLENNSLVLEVRPNAHTRARKQTLLSSVSAFHWNRPPNILEFFLTHKDHLVRLPIFLTPQKDYAGIPINTKDSL